MNLELKSILSVLFDLVQVGEDVYEKNYTALAGKLVSVISQVPTLVAHAGELQAEISALPGTAQEADLIAFIETKLVGLPGGDAAQVCAACLKILIHSADVVQDVIELKELVSK